MTLATMKGRKHVAPPAPVDGDNFSTNHKKVRTTVDKKVTAVNSLNSAGNSLAGISSYIEEQSNLLYNSTSKYKKNKAISNIGKARKVLNQLGEETKKNSIVLAPIASMSYVHRRENAQQNLASREAADKKGDWSLAFGAPTASSKFEAVFKDVTNRSW